MVETVAPVVYGHRRRYRLAVALHTLAAAASGAAVGVLLGGIGWAVGAPWDGRGYLVLAAVAGVYLLREVGVVRVPLPQARRQVPEWWRRFFGPLTTATLYGAGLGTGFATYLSYGTYAAVAGGVLICGDPSFGGMVCAAFGATRGVAVLAGRTAEDEEASAAFVERLALAARTRWPHFVNAAALAFVGVAALLSA